MLPPVVPYRSPGNCARRDAELASRIVCGEARTASWGRWRKDFCFIAGFAFLENEAGPNCVELARRQVHYIGPLSGI
jgi:hypothetical protein